MTRRQLLASAAAVNLSAAPEPFRYRGYLGWITDLATLPDTNAEWPSMKLDEPLLLDYSQTFRLMREWKLRDLCIWGLYVSRAWPLDLNDSVT